MTYYTAYFLNPDSNGKARTVLFGAKQVGYTFDQNEAFSTCQQMADETGDEITITEMKDINGHDIGYFHKVRPTKRTEV